MEHLFRSYYAISLLTIIALTSCGILKKQSKGYTENFMNMGIEMIEVKGGIFQMGCNESKRVCKDDELPIHNVYLDDFHIGKYEITFNQYDLFCENTGREKPDDNNWGRGNRPVINVNWIDADAFCKWLSKETGQNYRLPTEAEWEYAAIGGKNSKGFLYAGSNKINKVAWYSLDTIKASKKSLHLDRTNIVGKKNPNELNIYDISGNVWEWCDDGYDKDFYKKSPTSNPIAIGIPASARGGGWRTYDSYCITTNRDYETRGTKDNDLGFRVVLAK